MAQVLVALALACLDFSWSAECDHGCHCGDAHHRTASHRRREVSLLSCKIADAFADVFASVFPESILSDLLTVDAIAGAALTIIQGK